MCMWFYGRALLCSQAPMLKARRLLIPVICSQSWFPRSCMDTTLSVLTPLVAFSPRIAL